MRIGFYAPLKSPSHSNPSGDREIGRLFVKVLLALGHEVEVVSDLRSWEGQGSIQSQKRIRLAASKQVNQLLNDYVNSPAPELMFTYHVYHKAPDWIGIELAAALDIPYVIAEASFAPKQLNGPWDYGHRQTRRCIQQADRIIGLNPADIECLRPLVKDKDVIEIVKPFLDNITPETQEYPNIQMLSQHHSSNTNTVQLITVAMMRDGDKKASYKVLANALAKLKNPNWKLIIIGDGSAAAQIRRYFKGFEDKCVFTGELDKHTIFNYLSSSDVFVWPAVNEALGLAILEAQAHGLPVIAQNYGGVSTIVEDKITGFVTNPEDIGEFISALELLIKDNSIRQRMSDAAKHKFLSQHSFNVAQLQIKKIIEATGA